MKVLLLLTFLLPVSLYASEQNECMKLVKKEEKPICILKKKEPEPKVIYKTKWKTKVVEKPVYIKAKEKKCCSKKKSSYQRVKTGNQKVIIQMPKQKTKTIIKYRTRVKVKKKVINETNPNRLQVLVGQSKTKQKVEEVDCCALKATREHELDFGLQYSRDFGNVTGSVTGTLNQSYYLGIGVNW